MNKLLKSTQNSRGFTIIEVLTTLFVFSIMATLIVSIFGQAIQVERQATAAQKVDENALFILESMAKEIRVSTITSANNLTCTATTLAMTHPVNGSVTYSLSTGNLIRTDTNGANTMNSNDVVFNNLKFCITGNGGGASGDNQSVKITIIASIRANTGKAQFLANVQTTVVSRDIATELLN